MCVQWVFFLFLLQCSPACVGSVATDSENDLDVSVVPATFGENVSVLAEFAEIASQFNALRDGLTFWFSPGSTPRCSLEQMVAAVVALDARFGLPVQEIAGVEYWAHEGAQQAVHYDFDEYFYETPPPGAWPTPRYSSVTYLATGAGAPTLLLAQRQRETGGDAPEVPRMAALIAPRINKHVRFDGGLSHGILDPDDEESDRDLSNGSLGRTTLLVNYWSARPRGWDGRLAQLPPDLVEIFPLRPEGVKVATASLAKLHDVHDLTNDSLQQVVYRRYELPTLPGGEHKEVAWRARMPARGVSACSEQCLFKFPELPERADAQSTASEL